MQGRAGGGETPGIHCLTGLGSSDARGDVQMGVWRPVNSLKLPMVALGPVCSFPREKARFFPSVVTKRGTGPPKVVNHHFRETAPGRNEPWSRQKEAETWGQGTEIQGEGRGGRGQRQHPHWAH